MVHMVIWQINPGRAFWHTSGVWLWDFMSRSAVGSFSPPPPLVIPPLQPSPPPMGARHFDVALNKVLLCCALLFSVCWCPLLECIRDSFSCSDTNVCHKR